MLYFITKSTREYTWHIGARVPAIQETIVEVQADGHEYETLILTGLCDKSDKCVFNAHDIQARSIYTAMCAASKE